MQSSPLTRTQSVVVLVSTISLFTITVLAATGGTSRTSTTPAQIVEMVDNQVQPRFQVDAGMFGEERAVYEIVRGHRGLDTNLLVDNGNVGRQPYFIIMGMMHIRHKPGSHIGVHDAAMLIKRFKPSSEPVEASGTSYERACRSFAWAQDNIGPATMPEYDKVKNGNSVNTTYGKFYVAIRPIRAERAECISCHLGAHRGDVLGAMIYMVAPTSSHRPPDSVGTTAVPSDAG